MAIRRAVILASAPRRPRTRRPSRGSARADRAPVGACASASRKALAAAWLAWPGEPSSAAADENSTKKSSGCRVARSRFQVPSTFAAITRAKPIAVLLQEHRRRPGSRRRERCPAAERRGAAVSATTRSTVAASPRRLHTETGAPARGAPSIAAAAGSEGARRPTSTRCARRARRASAPRQQPEPAEAAGDEIGRPRGSQRRATGRARRVRLGEHDLADVARLRHEPERIGRRVPAGNACTGSGISSPRATMLDDLAQQRAGSPPARDRAVAPGR